MIRKLMLVALTSAAMSLVAARPVEAAPLSANNPYRSFNISGVNYGSMLWEQSHHSYSNARHGWGHRGGGFLFRRR